MSKIDIQAQLLIRAMSEGELASLSEWLRSGLTSSFWYARPRDIKSDALPFIRKWKASGIIEWGGRHNRMFHLTMLGRSIGRIIFNLDERGKPKEV